MRANGSEQLLTSHNDRGMALRGQKKWDEAEKMLRKTLELDKKLFGKSGSILESLGRAGRDLADLARDIGFEKSHRAELAHRQETLGIGHPQTLPVMAKLGMTLASQCRFAETEHLLRQLLPLTCKVLGSNDIEALAQRTELALTLSRLGRTEEAVQMERETLALKVEVLGEQHLSTLLSIRCMTTFLQILERYEGCLPYHERAYKGYLAVLGPEHPTTRKRRMYYECMQETVELETEKEKEEEGKENVVDGKDGKNVTVVKQRDEYENAEYQREWDKERRWKYGRKWRAGKELVRGLVKKGL
jgi:tetratricopeptide (TPR) repeat protein